MSARPGGLIVTGIVKVVSVISLEIFLLFVCGRDAISFPYYPLSDRFSRFSLPPDMSSLPRPKASVCSLDCRPTGHKSRDEFRSTSGSHILLPINVEACIFTSYSYFYLARIADVTFKACCLSLRSTDNPIAENQLIC